ncbi:histidine phosphatase superfamily [Xylariaceae sp. FL1651]|nr:histidine phosphatase superfamily [Xylariaceae sp. FL1651]
MIGPPAYFSIPAKGVGGETSSIYVPGELIDRGRETSLAFGKSLRQLYVDQLSLLPKHLSDAEILYTRTTEVPRFIESAQQILHGLYLLEPTRAFSQEAAEKWNGSDDMRYLSEKLGKGITSNKAVAVDSRPGLSAVMDTINATLVHGPDTRLLDEFYDERVRRVIDRIVVDEMFRGYSQLVGDMVLKMVDQVEWNRRYDMLQDPTLQSRAPPRLSLLGYHDRTIGIVLASLGFTTSLNCFASDGRHRRAPSLSMKESEQQWLWRDATTSLTPITNQGDTGEPRGIERRPVKKLATEEVHELDEYFMRVRYNDRIMTIPGCRAEGKYFDEDPSLCSLTNSLLEFWKHACNSNLGASSTTISNELAGY